MKKQLELFIDEAQLKLRDLNAQCELATDAAESVRQCLLSVRELQNTVDSHQTDVQQLQQISAVLVDTASKAHQTTVCSEVAALTDAIIKLTEMLMQLVSRLEVIDNRWTELHTQSNELRTLLAEKQETLQQTVHYTDLSLDQQYALVKVN